MKATIVCAVLLVLTGCAAQGPRQIIDVKGVNYQQFTQDQSECEAYAAQVSVGDSAAGGAVAGALIGALIGAAIGGSDGAKMGAGIFAVQGAAEGAGGAVRDKHQVVTRCMQGRGYKVLL